MSLTLKLAASLLLLQCESASETAVNPVFGPGAEIPSTPVVYLVNPWESSGGWGSHIAGALGTGLVGGIFEGAITGDVLGWSRAGNWS